MDGWIKKGNIDEANVGLAGHVPSGKFAQERSAWTIFIRNHIKLWGILLKKISKKALFGCKYSGT